MKLTGKKALVTGAAGGIGRAIALCLGDEGADVCVNDLPGRAKEAEEVVAGLKNKGRDAFFSAADVTSEEEVANLLDTVLDLFGNIDILVSNAGVSGAGASFPDITLEQWERMIRINLTSHFIVLKAVVPFMKARGYGRIVTIASTAGLSGIIKCNAHYAAAKGGLIALTKRLAKDYAASGITVNCVAPGLVRDTGFNERMADDILDAYVAQIPKGRPGYTNDVAGIAAFLSSDEADWITGQVIVVDGGTTC